MTATALDSVIFCDIFSTPQMRGVFSDETRTGYCLDFEAALARAQARLGIIPEKAAREIVRQCRIENIDFARLKKQTERIGYPILGIVQQIVELCADGLGEWCHWGANHTGHHRHVAIMQIRAALEARRTGHGGDRDRARGSFPGAIAILRWPAAATCSRRCRSPSASRRRRCSRRCSATCERLAQLKPRVLVGEFGGAVGTLASLGADGLKVQPH